jgi:hypothetical protein
LGGGEIKISPSTKVWTSEQLDGVWFILRHTKLTATLGGKFAKTSIQCAKFLIGVDAEPTVVDYPEAFNNLTTSWYGKCRSTVDMSKGSKNEGKVMTQLGQHPSVVFIGEIGLASCKDDYCIAASPDGLVALDSVLFQDIALFNNYVFTDRIGEKLVLWAGLEIKTKVSEQTVQHANDVKKYLKRFPMSNGFSFCECGDTIWFQAVPPNYRAQVVQQSVVLGLDHILFTVANETDKIYRLIIQVSADQRRWYKEALTPYADACCRFAYETGIAPNVIPPTYLPREDLGLHEEDRQDAISHIPMWKALHGLLDEQPNGQLLPPIKLFKHSYQSLYSRVKGGVDEWTVIFGNLDLNQHFKFDWDKQVAFRTICAGIVDSFLIYRICLCLPNTFEEFKNIDSFRGKMSNNINFQSFFRKFCLQIYDRYSTAKSTRRQLFVDNENGDIAAPDIAAPVHDFTNFKNGLKRKQRAFPKYFNSATGVNFRFSTCTTDSPSKSHKSVSSTQRKTCAWSRCQNKIKKHCNRCTVSLCGKHFERWHDEETLEEFNKQNIVGGGVRHHDEEDNEEEEEDDGMDPFILTGSWPAAESEDSEDEEDEDEEDDN